MKESFKARLLELEVEPVMPALLRLREAPGILGVSLRSGSLRLYAADAEGLLAAWRERWPFPEIRLAGPPLGGSGHGGRVHRLLAGLPRLAQPSLPPPRKPKPRFAMNFRLNPGAVASVARKEFLHIWRDRRILVLLVLLPPVFTLIFGHAFETPGTRGHARPARQRRRQRAQPAFRREARHQQGIPLAAAGCRRGSARRRTCSATACWPRWSSRRAGATAWTRANRSRCALFLDGSDTNTATELEGRVQESLGKFQLDERQVLIDNLPEEVFDLAKKLPVDVRKKFVASVTPWTLDNKILYNPRERFIDYVLPGIIGLILQLLTVTLTACTIARERESGTLYQLMVTSLRRGEIVIGKMLPYLGISIFLILVIIALAGWHFQVAFHAPWALAVICLLFLLCSLGLGLLISAFSRTQTQAIQFSVFFLLPVFVLSGAFAPLGTIAGGGARAFGMFPADAFLPGVPAGESLSSADLLRGGRSGGLAARSSRHLRRGGISPAAGAGIAVFGWVWAGEPYRAAVAGGGVVGCGSQQKAVILSGV